MKKTSIDQNLSSTSHQRPNFSPPMSGSEKNVGRNEQIASVAIGAALAGFGVERLIKGKWLVGAASLVGAGELFIRGFSGHCPLYQGLGIDTLNHRGPGVRTHEGVKVEKTLTIRKPAAELFQFWKHIENLPRIMTHLESVEEKGDRKSHWVAKAPAGFKVEWDAEIINEEENELIAWQSVANAEVENAGSVRFREIPGSVKTTEVKVSMKYNPPGGKMGDWLAKAFRQDPAKQIEEDLEEFKNFMEKGAGATPAVAGQGHPVSTGSLH
jgi:uncharacterized membrane protein